MSKVASIFNHYYDIQESWIERQVKDFKSDSFIDLSIVQKEIEDAGLVVFVNHESIDLFREKHLSKIGKKRLSATLRTHKKLEKHSSTVKRLDLFISRKSFADLEYLVSESGLTKIQIIEQLISKERDNQVDKM